MYSGLTHGPGLHYSYYLRLFRKLYILEVYSFPILKSFLPWLTSQQVQDTAQIKPKLFLYVAAAILLQIPSTRPAHCSFSDTTTKPTALTICSECMFLRMRWRCQIRLNTCYILMRTRRPVSRMSNNLIKYTNANFLNVWGSYSGRIKRNIFIYTIAFQNA